MSTWAQTAAQAGLLLAGAALFGIVVGALLARAFGQRATPAAATVQVAGATAPSGPVPTEASVDTAPLTAGPQYPRAPEAHTEPHAGKDRADEPASGPEATTDATGPEGDEQASAEAEGEGTEPEGDEQASAEAEGEGTEPEGDEQASAEAEGAGTEPATEPATDLQPPTADRATDLTDPEDLREQLRRSEERVAALGAEMVGLAELKEVEFGRLESGALRVLDATIAAGEARMAEAEHRFAALRAEHEQMSIRLEVATAEVERLRAAVAWRDGRLGELAEQLREAHRHPQGPPA